MKVYFSTVVRGAPVEQSGEFVAVDWGTKSVIHRDPIYPENPHIDDPNPRGNTRGARGIDILPNGRLLVSSYHSLYLYESDLKSRKQVTHPLMASLHENLLEGNSIWVTSTTLDAAIEIDWQTGRVLSQIWPREMPGLQKELNLAPMDIDKNADNRVLFLEQKHAKHPSHLHLNALARWHGDLYGLFHGFGAVVNLSRDHVMFRDPALKGAHNLIITDDGTAIVNNTYGREIRFYKLESGERLKVIDLMKIPPIRRLVSPAQELLYKARGAWNRAGFSYVANPMPFFVRGLDKVGDHLFVGFSPATVAQIDMHTGTLVDLFVYSRDLSVCTHGLRVDPK